MISIYSIPSHITIQYIPLENTTEYRNTEIYDQTFVEPWKVPKHQ